MTSFVCSQNKFLIVEIYFGLTEHFRSKGYELMQIKINTNVIYLFADDILIYLKVGPLLKCASEYSADSCYKIKIKEELQRTNRHAADVTVSVNRAFLNQTAFLSECINCCYHSNSGEKFPPKNRPIKRQHFCLAFSLTQTTSVGHNFIVLNYNNGPLCLRSVSN